MVRSRPMSRRRIRSATGLRVACYRRKSWSGSSAMPSLMTARHSSTLRRVAALVLVATSLSMAGAVNAVRMDQEITFAVRNAEREYLEGNASPTLQGDQPASAELIVLGHSNEQYGPPAVATMQMPG